MQQIAADVVYQGYTAEELSKQYAVHATIPDPGGYQGEAARMAAEAREKLSGALNVAYGEAEIQKLDIFAPDGGNAPVLIDIHGGGWTAGSKNSRSFVAEALVTKGIAFVPIDYGLGPDYGMPEIVDHVRSAVAWVYNNIADHGGDPDRIFVSGNSAGGHLTGTTMMPGWHGEYGIPADAIKGACAMSGVFDLEALYRVSEGPNDALEMDLETAKALSPLFHLPETSGPLIVGVGEPELDEFKRQAREFAAAWNGAGLDGQLIEVPGAHHFAMSREFGDPESALHKAITAMIGV